MDTSDRPSADSISENLFRAKVKRFAGRLGCRGVCLCFQLFYALQNPKLPPWAKAKILGALAYFISFVDAVPDLLPGVGYTDDIFVMLAAAGTVAMYIDLEVKQKAQHQVKRFFKNCQCSDPEATSE